MESIQESLSELQKLFVARMDAYQGELQTAQSAPNITALTTEFQAFRKFILTAIRNLQDQVGLLFNTTDSIEMRSRRKILLLHGVAEVKNEDVAATIASTLVRHLKMTDFRAADISRCHRLGRLAAPDKPRTILLKLHDLQLRNKIWNAKTGLKGSGITLSEFLTKSRHDTFMAARQKFGVTKCWTRDGFIFVLGGDGARHLVSSITELENIPAEPAASAPRAPAAGTSGVAAAEPAGSAGPDKNKRVITSKKKK